MASTDNHSDQTQPSILVSMTITLCVISALLIYLIAAHNFVFGSASGNWVYKYFNNIAPIPIWIPAAVLALLALFVFPGNYLIQRHEKTALSGGAVLVMLLQVLIHQVYPFTLGEIVQSDGATSFYSVAIRYSPLDILSRYGQISSAFPQHASSNMPGKILLFQLLHLFASSPEIDGYLIILISTLGAFLIYAICKVLFSDRQVGWFAFLLYCLIPARLVFFPILNTVTPVIILGCLYLFILYIQRKTSIFLVLLGVSLYILVLFEPSPLVAGMLFLGIFIQAWGEKRVSLKDGITIVWITVFSFLASFLLVWLVFSFNLFQTLHFVLVEAIKFNSVDNRDYWTWIVENCKEFFFGGGLPVMMIFIFMVIQLCGRLKNLGINITKWNMENNYLLCLLATFMVVLFLGINRGETTRLWVYLAVFFQIPAAIFLAKTPRNTWMLMAVAVTLAGQSLVMLNNVRFIAP